MPCHKKGNRLDFQNYRWISLPGKEFARVLNETVKRQTRDKIMEMHGGFRDRRSCTDQISL